MSLIKLAAATLAFILCSPGVAVAMPISFDFEFIQTRNGNGRVAGTIEGLNADGQNQAATSVIITEFTDPLSLFTLDPVAQGNLVPTALTNDFTVESGEIKRWNFLWISDPTIQYAPLKLTMGSKRLTGVVPESFSLIAGLTGTATKYPTAYDDSSVQVTLAGVVNEVPSPTPAVLLSAGLIAFGVRRKLTLRR